MARLLTCGFELNNGDKEPAITGAFSGTISSSVKRSGSYSMEVTLAGVAVSSQFQFLATATSGPHFPRAYFRFATFPAAENTIGYLTGSALAVRVTIDASGVLHLYDEDGSIGTSGSALSLDTWYRLEIHFDGTGVGALDTVKLYVDGSEVIGSTTRNVAATVSQFVVGGNLNSETDSTGHWYIDDVAVNDSTGTAQTGLPGAGSVVYARPNGEGEADVGSPTRGGTDSGTNFGQIDEQDPNDATDYIVLPANPSEIWVDVESSATIGIASGDAVTLVEVHGRISAQTASTSNWFPRIESQSGGTKVAGTTTTRASAAWETNDDTAGARQAKLVSYTDPQAGGSWTSGLIDTMQIAARTTDGNPDTWVSSLWAIIEYVPAATAITANAAVTALSAVAATVLTVVTLLAGAQSLGVSAPAAVLTTPGSDQNVTATPSALALRAPPATAQTVVTLAAAEQRLSLKAPTAIATAGATTIAANAVSLGVSAPQATLTVGAVTLQAGTSHLALTAPASTRTATATVSAPSAALGLSAPSASLTAGAVSLSASGQTLTLGPPPAAVLSGAVSLVAPSQTEALSAPTAVITSGQVQSVGAQTLALGAPNATVTAGATTLQAQAAVLALAAPPASVVTVGGPQTLSATAQTLTVTNPVSSLSAGPVTQLAAAQSLVVTAPNAAANAATAVVANSARLAVTAPAAVLVAGSTSISASSPVLAVVAPTATVISGSGPITLLASAQTLGIINPPSTITGGPVTRAAGAQQLALSAPSATSQASNLLATTSARMAVSAPTASLTAATAVTAGSIGISTSAPTASVFVGDITIQAAPTVLVLAAPAADLNVYSFRNVIIATIRDDNPTYTIAPTNPKRTVVFSG